MPRIVREVLGGGGTLVAAFRGEVIASAWARSTADSSSVRSGRGVFLPDSSASASARSIADSSSVASFALGLAGLGVGGGTLAFLRALGGAVLGGGGGGALAFGGPALGLAFGGGGGTLLATAMPSVVFLIERGGRSVPEPELAGRRGAARCSFSKVCVASRWLLASSGKNGASARFTCWAEKGRSRASLLISCERSVETPAGSEIVGVGGGWLACASSSASVSPENGGAPVSIS